MRWMSKPEHKNRDRRTIEKFLLLPRKINREWRWLEEATIEQECDIKYNGFYKTAKWTNVQWIQ